jgi:hypothetical protein
MFAVYLAERFKVSIFGPAAVVHAAAAVWAAKTGAGASVAATFGLAVVLLLQFRLWDDLEDRERDRRRHPARVLARANPTPFRWACALVAAANIVLLVIAGSRDAVLGLACLDLFFWIAYGPLRRRLSDRAWRFQILLVKYPAFVGVLATAFATPTRMRLCMAAAAVYVCACVYEAIHDRHMPLATHARLPRAGPGPGVTL